MTGQVKDSKAMFATAFGAMLTAASAMVDAAGAMDAATARELAVLSRVLERRLSEARQSLATATRQEGARIVDIARPHHTACVAASN